MHANPSLSWVLERVSHLQQGLPFPLPTLGGEGLWGGGLDTHNRVTLKAPHKFLLEKALASWSWSEQSKRSPKPQNIVE